MVTQSGLPKINPISPPFGNPQRGLGYCDAYYLSIATAVRNVILNHVKLHYRMFHCPMQYDHLAISCYFIFWYYIMISYYDILWYYTVIKYYDILYYIILYDSIFCHLVLYLFIYFILFVLFNIILFLNFFIKLHLNRPNTTSFSFYYYHLLPLLILFSSLLFLLPHSCFYSPTIEYFYHKYS